MAFTTAYARVAAEYGVPPAIIGKMVQTQPGRMYWLTPTDLKPMAVVVLTPSSPQGRPLPKAQPQTATTPRPETVPVTPSPSVTPRFSVYVASKQTITEALATFTDMQQKYTTLLASYRPMVAKAGLGAKGKGWSHFTI